MYVRSKYGRRTGTVSNTARADPVIAGGSVSAKDFPSLGLSGDWWLQRLKYGWPWLAR